MQQNKNIALVFPGQGCQMVGMGAELYETFAEARAVYDRADELLGFRLSRLCFQGPEEVLNDTSNTQPAIYVTTLALWKVLEPRLGAVRDKIAFAAGHSLGEFSALAVTGAMRWEHGLALVQRRGDAMREAGQQSPGGMAAIIGLDDDAVRSIVAQANQQVVGAWIANYNSPGQVVIAGRQDTLDCAMALAKEQGAKRAMPLAVSVACHTPLMDQASARLGEALEETPFARPWAPVISNAEARALDDPDEIKAALLRQLSSSVRWVESIQYMVDHGVTVALEVGPQAVVSGLIRRIHRSLVLHSVTNVQELTDFDGEALLA